ncbi:MAG: Holliday junction resolvase RuvX [candidate division WOR-3 bacterium]
MSRILCLDYGARRTGVAVSDETRTIAQSLPTIVCRSERELICAVQRLVADYAIAEIVLGLPVSLSGKPSTRSENVRAFAARLTRSTGIRVTLFDERLTTAMARRVLTETQQRPNQSLKKSHPRSRPRGDADRIAATIILEDYLARMRS